MPDSSDDATAGGFSWRRSGCFGGDDGRNEGAEERAGTKILGGWQNLYRRRLPEISSPLKASESDSSQSQDATKSAAAVHVRWATDDECVNYPARATFAQGSSHSRTSLDALPWCFGHGALVLWGPAIPNRTENWEPASQQAPGYPSQAPRSWRPQASFQRHRRPLPQLFTRDSYSICRTWRGL